MRPEKNKFVSSVRRWPSILERVYVLVAYTEVVDVEVLAAAVKSRRLSGTPVVCLIDTFKRFASYAINSPNFQCM